jgi:enoyl-[acyl-carrier-protein] reductase (NADH)
MDKKKGTMPLEQHTGSVQALSLSADTAVFLASDKASGMTGTVANLTGGMIVA